MSNLSSDPIVFNTWSQDKVEKECEQGYEMVKVPYQQAMGSLMYAMCT
jgi:hypothetical protein